LCCFKIVPSSRAIGRLLGVESVRQRRQITHGEGSRVHSHGGVLDGCDHPIRLVVSSPKTRVRCGKHDLEDARFRRTEIQLPVGTDVRLDALKKPEFTVLLVDLVDGPTLIGCFLHRHPAGDLQPVRMVRDGCECIASCLAAAQFLLSCVGRST